MMKKKGIAFKLAFFILASCAVIFVLIFGYNYFISRRIIAKDVRDKAEYLTLAAANKIEAFLRSVEKVPKNASYFLGITAYTKEDLLDLLRSVVEGNPEIYGSTISFEPYAFDSTALYFAPYFYRVREDGKKVTKFTYLGAADYQYFYLDWYLIPKELNAPAWSEPYYDKGGGNILMATYSVPFYSKPQQERKFSGVVTADVSLEHLSDIVSSIKIGKTGFGFLISTSGRIITHPDKELIMNETLFGIASQRRDPGLRSIAKDMVSGKRGYCFTDSLIEGKKCWLVYMPLYSSGWSLGVVFPQDEMFADIIGLTRAVFILGFLGFIILLAVIIAISQTITNPLRVLDRLTRDIAKGNLDFELSSLISGDEVGRLAGSFNYMREALKDYIKELTRATQAKERMESELRIAHDIQMGILPKSFPSLSRGSKFDIYALLEPAKEVGGDFYDFFQCGPEHLCFVIADVSDKGVPAALFMAMTKALIRMAAKETIDAAQILDKVNKEVCRENESCMFITVFLGVLNTRTGEVCYSNAGHNVPYLVRSAGRLERVSGVGAVALGLKADTVFINQKFTLEEKDIIFTYTDGVTEAFNTSREQFSEERLQNTLSVIGAVRPREIVRKVLEEVRLFSAGAEQSDDITLMALTFHPVCASADHMSIELANEPGATEKLKQSWVDFARDNDLNAEFTHDVGLAMDEVAVNIISYAWPDKSRHGIDISFGLESGVLTVRFADDGIAFNPLEHAASEIRAPLAERPQGGLGIHLARNLVDTLEYKRENSLNILVLKRKVP